ncbi:MAG: hypothetical protein RLZZ387_4308 [Chloroflexota bacterium]|jgi:hypothetical protein
MSADDLLVHLQLGPDHLLTAPLAAWVRDSRAFAAFAATYRDKIRKKIRGARDADSLRDLRSELEVAFLLLQEPRFTMVYEPAGQGKTRGPDFSVAFKGSVTFYIEVTRMRAAARALGAELPDTERTALERERIRERLQDIVCGKLQQLPAGAANALVLVADGVPVEMADLSAAISQLRLRAEQSDEHVLKRGGFRGPPDFVQHYQRLSAVALRRVAGGEPGVALGLWTNNQARHTLVASVQRCLGR